MHSKIRQSLVVLAVVCPTVLTVPANTYAQESRLSLEKRVSELEKLVQQLQQRVEQLEARLLAAPTKAPRVAGSGNWRDKAAWRKLRKEMTMDEVTAILGDPEKVDSGGILTHWYWDYPRGPKVIFNDSSLVWGWAEP